MNEDFTLHAFAEPVTELPDQPNLSAAEMKRRLQAPADEVRQVHNALAKTVKGITDATYPDTVTRDMLAPAVRQELAGKAEEATVAARLEAAEERMTAQLARKCEIYCGSFTATDYTNTVELGFRAAAVLVFTYGHPDGITGVSEFGTLALDGVPSKSLTITDTGFIAGENLCSGRKNTNPHRFIAFKPLA